MMRSPVLGSSDAFGLVEAEEPAFAVVGFGAEAVGDGAHGLAEGDGVLDGLVHEGGAGGVVHHGGGDVERRDERVEGRGGAVHHEGFVELVEVEGGAVRKFDVDHGAHGEGGEHLVGGLDGEDGGAVGHVVGDAHGEAVAVDGVELGVGVPGLVEVDAGDGFGELVDDAVDVVAEAVVGGVGDDGVGGLLGAGAGGEGAFGDELADVLGGEALEGNEADHAVAVARGLEVDGAGAGDGERVADGLVAVGVGEDDVVLGDDAVADDLVGVRGAAEDVEGPVGAEDAGGVAFGVSRGADVVEPGAERGGGDAEVGAEEVFAEEAVELLADGVLEEGDAAHVAGGVPGVGALVGVLLELAEVGREELLVVSLDGEVDAVGDEGGGVAEEVDVLVDLLDDFEGEFGDEGAVGDEEDGDAFVAVADGAEDFEGGAFVELVFAFEIPVEEDGGVGGIGGDERETVLGGGGSDHLVAFFADGFDEAFHGAIRDGIGASDFGGNQQDPATFIHTCSMLIGIGGKWVAVRGGEATRGRFTGNSTYRNLLSQSAVSCCWGYSLHPAFTTGLGFAPEAGSLGRAVWRRSECFSEERSHGRTPLGVADPQMFRCDTMEEL